MQVFSHVHSGSIKTDFTPTPVAMSSLATRKINIENKFMLTMKICSTSLWIDFTVALEWLLSLSTCHPLFKTSTTGNTSQGLSIQ